MIAPLYISSQGHFHRAAWSLQMQWSGLRGADRFLVRRSCVRAQSLLFSSEGKSRGTNSVAVTDVGPQMISYTYGWGGAHGAS